LRAVNPISAERTLGIIKSGIPSPSMANNLFSLGADGITFNPISTSQLNKALNGLSKDQPALILGYTKLINESTTNIVEVVKRNEKISAYGQIALGNETIKTGKDLDIESGGGFSGQAHFDGSLVKLGGDGVFTILTSNSIRLFDYNNTRAKSMPGEILAHEFLGHGLGRRGQSDSKQLDASIQAGNIFLRTQGVSYFRPDHGVSNHSKGFNPNEVPTYLLRFPFNF
jgi:hypothetical protein